MEKLGSLAQETNATSGSVYSSVPTLGLEL